MNVSNATAGEFVVSWPAPEDAELTWVRDAMHFPAAVTPLSAAYLRDCFEPGVKAACEALVMPMDALRNRAFNGWVYVCPVPAVPPEEMGARMEAHMGVMSEAMDSVRRRWDEEFLPEVQRLTAEIDALDFGGSGDGAATALDRLIEISVALWNIHFQVVFPKLASGERFSDIYTRITGTTEVMQPYRCLQGEPNKSLETDRALWDLAQDARATPEVAGALGTGAPAEVFAALGATPEGRAWRERFDRFLDEYGQRSQLIELASPTWVEEPAFAIENLRRYLTGAALDPEGQRERLLAESRAMMDAARERAAGDPDMLAALDGAYRVAREAWPLEEDHAFYIDQRALAGATRRALLRLADVLVEHGRLGDREDVWYLDFDDLRQGLLGADLADRAREGRRRHAGNSLLDPPPLIGAPPDPDAPADPGLVKFFGKPGPPEVDGRVLRGSAGSRGRVEGRARVVRSIDELHRVQAGEILVCRSTTPPWTPIFASIAALVTDAGGVLAHGAIVAREYGIPAVMGTKIGTQIIGDGQRITVDGDAGEVLIG